MLTVLMSADVGFSGLRTHGGEQLRHEHRTQEEAMTPC